MEIKKVRFVDTFAGIGGFHLAAEMACKELGVETECVKAVEFDEDACKTYEKNFNVNARGDMTKLAPAGFPDHDLLLGGFPCQPFSRNGKYYNKNGKVVPDSEEKAALCFRLFDILTAKRPALFVFENVKEIRTIKNADGVVMVEVIKDELKKCGYVTQVEVLNTADFGLPQQRKRAYFVGIREDIAARMSKPFEYPAPEPLGCRVIDKLEPREAVDKKFFLKELWKNRKIGQEKTDKHGNKQAFTVEDSIAKARELGCHKYADAMEKIWKENKEWGNSEVGRLEALECAYRCGEWEPKPKEEDCDIHPVAIIYGDTPSGLPRQQDKLYSVRGISPTIATFSTPAFDAPGGWRMLTPRECMRLQGFSDEYQIDKRMNVAYKQAGNAVSVNVARSVIKSLLAATMSILS